MNLGRFYEVTIEVRVEPGPHFEERKVTVRAYDASDAITQALIELNDPRATRIVRLVPAGYVDVQLADLYRMLRKEPESESGGEG